MEDGTKSFDAPLGFCGLLWRSSSLLRLQRILQSIQGSLAIQRGLGYCKRYFCHCWKILDVVRAIDRPTRQVLPALKILQDSSGFLGDLWGILGDSFEFKFKVLAKNQPPSHGADQYKWICQNSTRFLGVLGDPARILGLLWGWG